MIEERLDEIVEWDAADPEAYVSLNTTGLLNLAGIEHPTNPQAKECASILRSRLGEPKRIQGVVKWRVPLRPRERAPSPSSRPRPDKFD